MFDDDGVLTINEALERAAKAYAVNESAQATKISCALNAANLPFMTWEAKVALARRILDHQAAKKRPQQALVLWLQDAIDAGP